MMKLSTIAVGPFEVNCYLYWDEDTREGVIIDPGDDEGAIFEDVERAGMTPKAILLTHGHGDHIAAVEDVRNRYEIPLYAGRGEEKNLANPSPEVCAIIGRQISALTAEHVIEDEQIIQIGSVTLRVLATPGHTPGGVCFLDEKESILFTGDTLFWGSVGRVDLPGGSGPVLIDSIQKKILVLPDEVICYPGHGPKTTVGGERTNNPFLSGGYFV